MDKWAAKIVRFAPSHPAVFPTGGPNRVNNSSGRGRRENNPSIRSVYGALLSPFRARDHGAGEPAASQTPASMLRALIANPAVLKSPAGTRSTYDRWNYFSLLRCDWDALDRSNLYLTLVEWNYRCSFSCSLTRILEDGFVVCSWFLLGYCVSSEIFWRRV